MAPRRSLLITGLVVLLTIFTTNSVVQAQTSTTTTITTTSNSTTEASFCEQCRDKGVCTQAYKGSPGIFCGNWLSASSQRLACCCPASALCAVAMSNYECKCRAPNKSKSTEAPSNDQLVSPSKVRMFLIGAAVFLVFAAIVFCCMQRCNNAESTCETPRPYAVAQPIYATQQPAYITQQPMYGQPAPMVYGAPQPMYQGGQYAQDDRRGFGGGAVVAGAAAGMLGGLIVGDMLADAVHSDGGGNSGGDVFAGDF